jgi:hypothetical protein
MHTVVSGANRLERVGVAALADEEWWWWGGLGKRSWS